MAFSAFVDLGYKPVNLTISAEPVVKRFGNGVVFKLRL